jgi:ESF2/ABP1 family protein
MSSFKDTSDNNLVSSNEPDFKEHELLKLQNKSSVKTLSEKKLKEFQEEQDKTGVIYLSRIPPFMKPHKLRSLLSVYGEIGRVYLAPEGEMHYLGKFKRECI